MWWNSRIRYEEKAETQNSYAAQSTCPKSHTFGALACAASVLHELRRLSCSSALPAAAQADVTQVAYDRFQPQNNNRTTTLEGSHQYGRAAQHRAL